MHRWHFLFYLLTLLLLVGGCSEDDTTATTTPSIEQNSASKDSDGDGLSDKDETTRYFTAVHIKDSDGDGISDGEEVLEYGFNPTANPYRFNPLIADLPTIKIDISTVPKLRLNYTDSQGQQKSASNANGGANIKTDSSSDASGASVSIAIEKKTKLGTETGGEFSVKGTLARSYSHTDVETRTDQKTWNRIQSETNATKRITDSGEISIGINIENSSYLPFTLTHLTLVASFYDGNDILPIATLGYNSGNGGFSPTTFAPFERSNTLLFSQNALNLDTALSILKDGRSIIVEPALYELSNKDGKPFDFSRGDVSAKCAQILIDYGVLRVQEQYYVSTLGTHGNGTAVSLEHLLHDALHMPFTTTTHLNSLREVVETNSSRWVIQHTHSNGITRETTRYDWQLSEYNVSSVILNAGDTVAIVYLSDTDGDGVGIREEILNGTDPKLADTDFDGLQDDIEIRTKQLINAINVSEPNRYPAYVSSNPNVADADEDGLNDKEELERGLDPNNADTDGDGIGDYTDTFNGQKPVAANFRITQSSKSRITLFGSATPNATSRITNITLDWGDGSTNASIDSTSNQPLFINTTHDYNVTASDENNYTITLAVTRMRIDDNSTLDVTYYQGSITIYKTITSNVLTSAYHRNQSDHLYLQDMNKDTYADLIEINASGVYVAAFNSTLNSFEPPVRFTKEFSSSASYPNLSLTSRELHDFNADGYPDLLAFATDALRVGFNNGSGIDSGVTFTQTPGNFTPATGWNDTALYKHSFGDIDGNGFVDIVGFGEGAVLVERNLDGSNTVGIEGIKDFTAGTYGWDNEDYRFIVDINNDGREDIVAFGSNAMFVALAKLDGTFASTQPIKTAAQSPISTATGWQSSKHLVLIDDINNDYLNDIIGFGYASVLVYLNQSYGSTIRFSSPQVYSSGYTYNQGWRINANPRFLADVNGDGFKDIVGYGTGALIASLNRLSEGENRFDEQAIILSERFNTGSAFQSDNRFNARFCIDINKDGHADAIGLSNSGIIIERTSIIVQPAEQ